MHLPPNFSYYYVQILCKSTASTVKSPTLVTLAAYIVVVVSASCSVTPVWAAWVAAACVVVVGLAVVVEVVAVVEGRW